MPAASCVGVMCVLNTPTPTTTHTPTPTPTNTATPTQSPTPTPTGPVKAPALGAPNSVAFAVAALGLALCGLLSLTFRRNRH